MQAPTFKVCFYVPMTHADPVKEAIFAAGAGRMGNYDKCAWQTLGTGQFRPLEGSQAFIGEVGTVEQVEEAKVETVCSAECLAAVIAALIAAHPYETPAFDYWPVSTRLPSAFGRQTATGDASLGESRVES